MAEIQSPEKPRGGSATDHLANERTFLAWIRTSAAIMGFGFVVVKFALFIRQISVAIDKPQANLAGRGYSTQIGIFLVGVGAFIALYSYLHFLNTKRQLLNGAYKPSSLPALLLTIIIVIIGALLVYNLVPNI